MSASHRVSSRGARLVVVTSADRRARLSDATTLASDVNADLIAVDLANAVSKWIGETEKNLTAVLDDAERTRSVLFFDEADALFGRRTGARPRSNGYANLEVSHLLHRLADFGGVPLVVLGTTRVPTDPPPGVTVIGLAERDPRPLGRPDLRGRGTSGTTRRDPAQEERPH
ncbi:MAG: AAA family ATPase [Ornithinibacter sp.]